MRISLSIPLLALAAVAGAQSPLTTLAGGTNQGNIGNNIYFNLQINQTVTITQIDFRCGANTAASSAGILEVYLGPTTYVGNTLSPALWILVASASGLTVAPSSVSTAVLTVPLVLGPGNYGVALRSVGFNHGYSNGDGNATPGSGTNQTFTRTEMVLRAGANQNTPWSTGLNQPRVFNGAIYYTLGGTPIVVAAWETYGDGCYKWFHSFYETYLNPSTSFDLKNTAGNVNSLLLKFKGSGYTVGPFVNSTGTFFTPTAAATNLALGNDSTATIATPFPIFYPGPGGIPQGTSSLEVSDNGYISPVTGNGSIAVPAIGTFLAGMPRWAAAWFDFDPSIGVGQVNWEVDPNGQALYVSWISVPDVLAPATSNTMQVMFANNGDVEFRWSTMSLNIGGTKPCLVGWTVGGSVADPGLVDISAITTPFNTGPTDNPPLALGLQARPQLGTTATFITSDIPAGTGNGALLIGFRQQTPSTPLAVIGMPDCFLHVSLTNALNLGFTTTTSTAQVMVSIPNNLALNGGRLFDQSVTLTPGYNRLGLLSSNGVRMTVGSL